MAKNIRKLSKEQFGTLRPLIENDDITEINWNGRQLIIKDLHRGPYVSDLILEQKFIEQFSNNIANVASLPFNPYNPVLEADMNELRISIIHEEVSKTGRAISVRKSPAINRMTMDSILESAYCPPAMLHFLTNAVNAYASIVVCGETGAGKTELLKFLTSYIKTMDRMITIEDVRELHCSKLHPNHDVIEMEIKDHFSYAQAIKAALRQSPKWIILSEARGEEARELITSLSTGHHGLTTVHTDDVRNIPDRFKTMVRETALEERMEADVYRYLDIGVMIKLDELADGGIKRRIDQVCVFERPEHGKGQIKMLMNYGEMKEENPIFLPMDLQKKFKDAGILDPFCKEAVSYEK